MTRRLTTIALRLVLAAALAPIGLVAVHAQSGSVKGSSALRADLRGETVAAEVRHMADWAVHSGDHRKLPFIVVDKVNARAVAFDAHGRLIRSTPVLLGMGVGDTFAPGVVNMDMYETQPSQRITPAGRFFADEGENTAGERVLWVDYDNGIAIHKLSAKRTKQRRHERMRSPDPAQHRITYGCINVPPAFYDQVVRPQFKRKGGIVYVLPDSTPLKAVFKSYDVNERAYARLQTSALRAPTVPAAARFQAHNVRVTESLRIAP